MTLSPVTLTTEGWSALQYAINNGTSLQFPLDDDNFFSIRYTSIPYFDNFANLSALRLEDIKNPSPALGYDTHVVLEQFNLVALPSSTESGMKVLETYIRDVHEMLLLNIPADPQGAPGSLVLIKIELPPRNSQWLVMASNSGQGALPLSETYNWVSSIPIPEVWRNGRVSFDVVFGIWNGNLSGQVAKEVSWFYAGNSTEVK